MTVVETVHICCEEEEGIKKALENGTESRIVKKIAAAAVAADRRLLFLESLVMVNA
jgi:hypothetical protein